MKKLLVLLSLFVFLSLVVFSLFLYGKGSQTFYAPPRFVQHLKKNFWGAADKAEEVNTNQGTGAGKFSWKNTVSAQEANVTPKKTEVVAEAPEKPEVVAEAPEKPEGCPETPPDLVGPLLVDFNKRTLEEVREKVGSPLQEGGRYKPPDCISRHKVAVIIPFRNRHEHMIHWLYYLHPILIRQQLDYGVYVINQDGDGVFNRAKLMNVGYMEALKDYDYDCFVFSDIDLVPLDDRNLYRCFDQPRHLAVGMDKFNFNLPYKAFFGGVSSLSKQQFLKINGFPNTYWGWGGEDDDIYRRIVYSGMQVSRPDLITGKYKMIKHQRDLHNEPNPKNPDKINETRRTMKADGINSLTYTVKNIVKDKLYTFITVDIQAPIS